MSETTSDCVTSTTREEVLVKNGGSVSSVVAVNSSSVNTTIAETITPISNISTIIATDTTTNNVVSVSSPMQSPPPPHTTTPLSPPPSQPPSQPTSQPPLQPSSEPPSQPPSSPPSPPSATNTDDDKAAQQLIDPQADLLKWKDMPRHLQFNQYIVEGYRPLTNFKGCIHSLFYFHNETVNIFTHGIPVLYILATIPYLMPWSNFRFLSWCHLIGSLAPWCGSFVYHLFMNLDQGEVVYYRLLKLDMFGIWMSQSFGAITFVTATAFCWKIKWLLIFSYGMLCLWGLYKALLASSPWERRLCFLFPFVMRLHLVILRMFKLAGGNTESMVHVYLQDGVSIVGGAIGAMNIPEKWLPGNVDFCLNSHNIMHVLVVVAVYSMHQATMRDLEWMSKNQCGNSVVDNSTIESIHDSHTDL